MNEKIEKQIISEVSFNYRQYFVIKKVKSCDSCLTIDFETKSKYSSSINLHLFESIMRRYVEDLQKVLDGWKFWSCSSCSLEFVSE